MRALRVTSPEMPTSRGVDVQAILAACDDTLLAEVRAGMHDGVVAAMLRHPRVRRSDRLLEALRARRGV